MGTFVLVFILLLLWTAIVVCLSMVSRRFLSSAVSTFGKVCHRISCNTLMITRDLLTGRLTVKHLFQIRPMYWPAIVRNAHHVAPHMVQLCEETGEVYTPQEVDMLMAHIDKIAPLTGDLMDVAPRIRPYSSLLLPHVDELAPRLSVLKPHMDQMLLHMDLLAPHLGALLPHMDALLPVLSQLLENLPRLEPYLPALVSRMDLLAPHMQKLMDNFEQVSYSSLNIL